jgi:hypothetical protein
MVVRVFRMRLAWKLMWPVAVLTWPLQVICAQDLSPRAYVITATHSNAITLTCSFYDGSVLFNGTVPITGASGTYGVPVLSYYKRLLYDLLFRASAATMLEVARDPKHLGADIGLLSVLHTWGQNLQHHPHIHVIVPAGGLTSNRSGWIATSPRFFLPVYVLSRVFRRKFADGLTQIFDQNKLQFHGSIIGLAQPDRFHRFVDKLFRQRWVVYAKPPFGGAEHVLHYLARYTHRVAISNHRLVAFQDDQVSFRWKDYVHGGKQKLMTLPADEFLRRFLLHVLPKGLVRIRHFGLFANRTRSAMLALCRSLLGPPLASTSPLSTQQLCPLCSSAMVLVERLTAYQLHLCSTPTPVTQLRPSVSS